MTNCRHRLSLALILYGCQPTQDQTDRHSEPATVQEAADHVEIPAIVRDNLGITFAKAEVRRVAQTIRIPGSFELEPLARHEYRMSLPGRVELLVDQYQPVDPNQILFRFESPAWPELVHEIIVSDQQIESAHGQIEVAQAKIQETRANLAVLQDRRSALAQADFKRADLDTQALQLEASLPRLQAELQLAKTHLENARRSRDHALHRAETVSGVPESQLVELVLDGDREVPRYLTVQNIEVRAEHRGMVERLEVTDGAYVEVSDLVVSTVDLEQVRFRALALQADLPELATADAAQIVPPQTPGYDLAEAIPVTLTIGLEAHPEERTQTLIARPTATANWARPGVSAFLEVIVKSSEGGVLAIPRSCVVKDGITDVFFRRNPRDPNQALRVVADLGVTDGRWVEIRSGLARNDEVVLAGAYELKLASQLREGPQTGGHFHADGSFHQE